VPVARSERASGEPHWTSRWLRGLPRSAIALAVGTVLAIALGELLVRILGAAPEVAWFTRDQFRLSSNTMIGWEPVPDPEAASAPAGTVPPSGRNSLGFRDREHPLRPPAPGRRIIVLGDSITRGLGIPEPEGIFTTVMESRLAAAGGGVEVLNFGVEGYNTQQEVEMLKDRGLAYRPDLVVLAYCLNDRTWPAHHLYRELLEAERDGNRVSGARMSPWLGSSALYRFFRFRVFSGAGSADDPAGEVQDLLDRVQGDTVEDYFGVLAGLSEHHGFDVLVVVFPWLDGLQEYSRFEDHRWVARLSARHGFHHLDLLPALVECERHYGHSVAADEVHPNALGHRCAGLAIADYIHRRLAAPEGGF